MAYHEAVPGPACGPLSMAWNDLYAHNTTGSSLKTKQIQENSPVGGRGEDWSRVLYLVLTLPGETPNVKQSNRLAAWQGVKPE